MKKIIRIGLLAGLVMCMMLGAAFAEGSREIAPVPFTDELADLQNGSFCLEVEDMDRIDNSGYFTAVLYLEDLYEAEQIEGMKKGDKIWVNGTWFTVGEIVLHEEEVYWDGDNAEPPKEGEPAVQITYEIMLPEDAVYEYIVFQKAGNGYYHAVVDDWNPVSLITRIKVMLPLPDQFVYKEMSGGGAEEDLFGAEDFLDLLRGDDGEDREGEEEGTCFFSPYNTYVRFKDGMITEIENYSYPYGPESD